MHPRLIFPNKEEFLDVLRDFCILEGFGLNIEKDDKKRFTTTCIRNAVNEGYMHH